MILQRAYCVQPQFRHVSGVLPRGQSLQAYLRTDEHGWTIIAFQVITTRSYDERLGTISAVRDAGISVCSGGILGLGETDKDRVGLIWEVAK